MSQRQTCGVAIDVSDEMRRIWNGPTRDEQGFLVKVGFEADEPLDGCDREKQERLCAGLSDGCGGVVAAMSMRFSDGGWIGEGLAALRSRPWWGCRRTASSTQARTDNQALSLIL
jgi:hypothetical protein